MALIDIGAEVKDRASVWNQGYTLIGKDNPANASGTITSVEIWVNTTMYNFVVGTFYTTNGNTFKCRDSEEIPVAITPGSKQPFAVNLAVETGDYIGLHFLLGRIERDIEGYAGLWHILGKYMDPGDEATYDFREGDALSLYGTGETPPGWSGKISGVTNPAKVMGVDKANINKVKGVASA
ncbi:hypothetical protein ES708_24262 [subsurface metagenome]